MQHRQGPAEALRMGGDLQRATGIAGHDRIGAGVEQIAGLALAELCGGLGLDQVVDAR